MKKKIKGKNINKAENANHLRIVSPLKYSSSHVHFHLKTAPAIHHGLRRLFRIGFDSFLPTISPLITWFLVGLVISDDLFSVNAVIYPIFFIYRLVTAIFGMGANISSHRYQKTYSSQNNEIYTAMILGAISIVCVTVGVILNLDSFLAFLNIQTTLSEYYILAILQFAMFYLINLVLQRLWFVGDNKSANICTLWFNFILLASTVLSALTVKFYGLNDWFVVAGGTIFLLIFTIATLAKNFQIPDRFIFRFHNWVRLSLVDIVYNIFAFVCFSVGYSNAFNFGHEWILLISFNKMITDAQWDATVAENMSSSIDAAHDEFNYREHRRDALAYASFLALSTIVMFIVLFNFYNINLGWAILICLLDVVCFFPNAIYSIQANYLQVHGKSGVLAGNKMVATILRICCSLLPTPLCNSIGMVASIIYQYITVKIIYFRHARHVAKEVRETLL